MTSRSTAPFKSALSGFMVSTIHYYHVSQAAEQYQREATEETSHHYHQMLLREIEIAKHSLPETISAIDAVLEAGVEDDGIRKIMTEAREFTRGRLFRVKILDDQLRDMAMDLDDDYLSEMVHFNQAVADDDSEDDEDDELDESAEESSAIPIDIVDPSNDDFEDELEEDDDDSEESDDESYSEPEEESEEYDESADEIILTSDPIESTQPVIITPAPTVSAEKASAPQVTLTPEEVDRIIQIRLEEARRLTQTKKETAEVVAPQHLDVDAYTVQEEPESRTSIRDVVEDGIAKVKRKTTTRKVSTGRKTTAKGTTARKTTVRKTTAKKVLDDDSEEASRWRTSLSRVAHAVRPLLSRNTRRISRRLERWISHPL